MTLSARLLGIARLRTLPGRASGRGQPMPLSPRYPVNRASFRTASPRVARRSPRGSDVPRRRLLRRLPRDLVSRGALPRLARIRAHLALSIPLLDPEPHARTKPVAIFGLYPLVDSFPADGPALSPIAHLEGGNLPPTYFLQGEQDGMRTTPPAKTRAFCAKANALAAKPVCEAEFLSGPPEFFHGFIGSREPDRRMLGYFDRFLIAQGLYPSAGEPFDPVGE